MEIIIGKTAGFCYGVKNAVDKASRDIKENNNLYCLGELVHNKKVVDDLKDEGLKFIDDIKNAKTTTIIRAHGIPKNVYKYAKENNIELKDYTCPNVLNIHKIAEDYKNKGYYIFLLGKSTHPENIATISFCGKNSMIIEDIDDVEQAIEEFKKSNIKDLLVISQTTFSLEKFYKIENLIKEKIDESINLVIKNTICKATELRQKETEELSKKVDYMIIIGGSNSSNTKKLYEVATKFCKRTICIEDSNELNIKDFKNIKKVGVMAGASTPNVSIEEVINKIKSYPIG